MALFRKKPESQPPVEDLSTASVVVAGHDLALRDVVVGARVDRGRLGVEVHHPVFTELGPDHRDEAAKAVLAATLGLPLAAQVVAEVVPATHTPIDSFGLPALRSFVESLTSGTA